MNCCRKEKNSVSNFSMEKTVKKRQGGKKRLNDAPAGVHHRIKRTAENEETRHRRRARQGQTHGKGVKKKNRRKHTGHKTVGKKQRLANTAKAASQTTEHGQSDATVKSKISEMGPDGTLDETCQKDKVRMETLADTSQSAQGQRDVTDALHNLEMTGQVIPEQTNQGSAKATKISELTAREGQRDVTAVKQTSTTPSGQENPEQAIQGSAEAIAITELASREGQRDVTAVQQTSTTHSGLENPSHTGHNEVTTQAVALRSTRLHNQVLTTQDGRRTIPVGQTVIIEDIDGPAITQHGERVHVKGKRIVVQQPGKCGKIGKKKYVVRKEETKMGTWLDRMLRTEHHHTSQQSYFVSDSEDEDKEYLNAAAENLDMNW